MNRWGGVLQTSSPPLQQIMADNPNNNNNNNYNYYYTTTTPPPSFLATYSSSSHDDDYNQDLPHSWSHLLMSGMVSEEEMVNNVVVVDNVNNKQENSVHSTSASYVYGSQHQLFQQLKPSQTQLAPPLPPPPPSSSSSSSPTPSFTTTMLDFSDNSNNNNNITESRPTPPPAADPSISECNSSSGGGGGGTFKKARVEPSTIQSSSTFKVRKEKLGDRITALHQLVSPFGKTDTASVLLEAIGYIRFLQSQIEALSLPYLGSSGTGNTRHQQQPLRYNNNNYNVQGENNCLFPEDPGQLLNENCLKRKAATSSEQDYEEEAKKDLKSRGLCLIPVSCTQQVGSDNIIGADYWAPAFGGAFQ